MLNLLSILKTKIKLFARDKETYSKNTFSKKNFWKNNDLKNEIKETQIDIHQSESPVARSKRRIPFALREKVAREKILDENDIIEVVSNEPTPWLNPIVAVHEDSDNTFFSMKVRNVDFKVTSVN